jgi:hypothetical protein
LKINTVARLFAGTAFVLLTVIPAAAQDRSVPPTNPLVAPSETTAALQASAPRPLFGSLTEIGRFLDAPPEPSGQGRATLFMDVNPGGTGSSAAASALSLRRGDDEPTCPCWEASGEIVHGPSDSGPGGNVAVRKDVTNEEDDELAPLGLRGQSRSGTTFRTRKVVTSVVGEFAFYRLSGFNVEGFLGGARVGRRLNPNVGVFGQFLAGGLHFPGATDFALQPGGGVEFFVKGKPYRFDAQLDFPIDFFQGGGGHETDTRFGFAVVFPLKHK